MYQLLTILIIVVEIIVTFYVLGGGVLFSTFPIVIVDIIVVEFFTVAIIITAPSPLRELAMMAKWIRHRWRNQNLFLDQTHINFNSKNNLFFIYLLYVIFSYITKIFTPSLYITQIAFFVCLFIYFYIQSVCKL